MATVAKRARPAKEATPKSEAAPELSVSVAVERSIGTAIGFDEELPALRRKLEFEVARFLINRGLKGRWTVLAYVSREGVK